MTSQPESVQLRPAVSFNTSQVIESEVLRPVVFSSDNTFARFELEPKGYLSPSSSISFTVSPNANVKRAFFPVGIGVHSLISRAVLRTSSGRVLSDIEEFGHLKSLTSMYVANDAQAQREQYLNGRCVDFQFNYDGAGADSVGTYSANSYGLANGREYVQKNILNKEDDATTKSSAQQSGLNHHNFQVISNDANRLTLSPSYSITLHDLFPFLKSRSAEDQLPLFMFESDRVQIELYFTDPKNERVSVGGVVALNPLDNSFLIDQNSVELISDHIFYPTQTLEQQKAQASKEPFRYFDYILSRQTLKASSANSFKDDNTTNNIRNVGGAGRVVTRVFTGIVPQTSQEATPLNSYVSEAPVKQGDFVGRLESNIFYNERYLFPQTLSNGARQFHNLSDSTSRHIYTTREMYSNGGNLIAGNDSDLFYEGVRQDTSLAGKSFWQGFRLNRGERVGSKGIDLNISLTKTADGKTFTQGGLVDGTYIQYSFLEVQRFAEMKGGQIDVFFA